LVFTVDRARVSYFQYRKRLGVWLGTIHGYRLKSTVS